MATVRKFVFLNVFNNYFAFPVFETLPGVRSCALPLNSPVQLAAGNAAAAS